VPIGNKDRDTFKVLSVFFLVHVRMK